MGYSLFVEFDHDIPNVWGGGMCGKILARNIQQLDDEAMCLSVQPLSEMISISEAGLRGLVHGNIEYEVGERWFEPSKGLATVTALVSLVQDSPDQFYYSSALLEDLITMRFYLESADQHNALFHLTPDF